MFTLLIIARDDALARDLSSRLGRYPLLRYEGAVSTAEEGALRIRRGPVAVAIIDVDAVGPGGLHFLIERRRRLRRYPRFIALSAREKRVHEAFEKGADEAFLMPADGDVVLQRAVAAASRPEPGRRWFLTAATPGRGAVEATVHALLTELGVPRHLTGYGYLLEAISAAARNPDLLSAMTGRLYPLVALQRGSTPRQVERAIRTCIEATWNRGNLDALDALFSFQIDPQRAKPTNAAFIARLVSEVRSTRLPAMRRRRSASGAP